VTLRLEGRVVAEWAALLERECSDLLRSRGAVSLELAGVSFVDRAGIQALERLSRAGVEIRCPPGAVASVLEGEGIRLTREAAGVDDRRP
jgi:anti-anti-sigma regulatory factor